jgi:cytosine deaminase
VNDALHGHKWDMRLMKIAIHEAQKSLSEGGVPIGAALARGDNLLASGHNERVQRGDPIAHGEIACLRNAGRQETYGDTTLYTTLSPCEMCSGAILLFKIPRVIVGESTTFPGNLDRLRRKGVEVVLLEDDSCTQLMRTFQQKHPRIWLEDIGEASVS